MIRIRNDQKIPGSQMWEFAASPSNIIVNFIFLGYGLLVRQLMISSWALGYYFLRFLDQMINPIRRFIDDEKGCAESPLFVFVPVFVEAAKLFCMCIRIKVPYEGGPHTGSRTGVSQIIIWHCTALTTELKLYSSPHCRQTSTYLYIHDTETLCNM